MRYTAPTRLSWTIKMEMAAGVIPDILLAWPRVMGLMVESFSLISLERPGVPW